MKRDEWTMPYKGGKLMQAASKKVEFHESRRKWWLDKKEEVLATLKAKGITVTENIVDELSKASYSNTAAFGRGPTVQIDQGMQAQLMEATLKVREHFDKRDEYRAWVQNLEMHAEDSFALDHEDWVFFFGNISDTATS